MVAPVTLSVPTAPQPISNTKVPVEGPRSIGITLDYSAGGDLIYKADLGAVIQQRVLSLVQTLFVDNSLNNETLVITTDAGQIVKCPAAAQGFFPVLCGSSPQFLFEMNGGSDKTQVFFINVLIPYQVWSSAGGIGGFIFNGSGYALVSDPVLDGCVTGGKVKVTDTILDACVAANQVAISVANGADVTLGAKADVAAVTGSASVIALLKGLATLLAAYSYFNDAVGSAGVQLKGAPGTLGGLTINTAGTASSVSLYDSVGVAANLIGTFDTTVLGEVTVPATGIAFTNGLWYVASTVTPANLTVLFK